MADGFGRCARCDFAAVLLLNGQPVCMEHFDSALAELTAVLREASHRLFCPEVE